MSVALMYDRDLAALALALTEVAKMPEVDALDIAEAYAKANHETFWYQYTPAEGETIDPPVSRDAIKAAMSDPNLFSRGIFGPFRYNLYTNGGTQFGDDDLHGVLAVTQERVYRYFERMHKAWERKQQQQLADELCPKMPKRSAKELLEVAQSIKKGGQLIVAEYMLNDSDSNTDYYGGIVARRIAIGICGSRNNFSVMRKAAAEFPPTEHLGPGKDQWRVCVILKTDTHRETYEMLREANYSAVETATREEIEARVQDEIARKTDWGRLAVCGTLDYRFESIEHREDYSGGGGYYLGHHRYAGWRIRCEKWGGSSELEIFDPQLLNAVAAPPVQVVTEAEVMAVESVVEVEKVADVSLEDWMQWL